MNTELTSPESLLTDKPTHFEFVVDADLVRVGGGTVVTDY